jgi:hypothetical protein
MNIDNDTAQIDDEGDADIEARSYGSWSGKSSGPSIDSTTRTVAVILDVRVRGDRVVEFRVRGQRELSGRDILANILSEPAPPWVKATDA